MFKKAAIVFTLFFFQIQAFGDELSSSINSILKSFDFDRDSVVSISIRDKNNKVVYEKSPYKFLNPASTLKLFTMAASIDMLGENFSFDTAIYKDKKNNLYLKLSGDPLLNSADLEALANSLKQTYKGKIGKIYIDDSVIDKVPYPDGWTIDDYWPNSPKLSPYMVDYNTVKVSFYPGENQDVKIVQKNEYKFPFLNQLSVGGKTSVNFQFDDLTQTVELKGTIAGDCVEKSIPVLNPKLFFCQKMNSALNKSGIKFHDKFLFQKTPSDAVLVTKFSRPLVDVAKHILTTSDNTSSEMVFKVAGAKYAKEKSPVKSDLATFGTTENGVLMFEDFCAKKGLDFKQIKIKDGSGVSRYNALNANWMTNALLKTGFDCEKYLPTTGVGTLAKRMRELKDKVYFKTGTLFGTSSLIGAIKTSDNEFYFASVVMSYNRNSSLIKGVEDEIVYEVYRIENNEEN